jgi:hypothetical protein
LRSPLDGGGVKGSFFLPLDSGTASPLSVWVVTLRWLLACHTLEMSAEGKWHTMSL